MSADLRFVAHASETDSHIFLFERPRNRFCNRRLSGARRPDETDNRRILLPGRGPHRQKFQHALLHFSQPVMILVQDPLRIPDIPVILARFIPRQLQQRFNVPAGYGALGRAAAHGAESPDLLADALFDFLRCRKFLALAGKLFGIPERAGIPKLLLDYLKLFAKHVIALIFINFLLDRLLYSLFDADNIDFIGQNNRFGLKLADQPVPAQNHLLFRHGKRQLHRDLLDQPVQL